MNKVKKVDCYADKKKLHRWKMSTSQRETLDNHRTVLADTEDCQ